MWVSLNNSQIATALASCRHHFSGRLCTVTSALDCWQYSRALAHIHPYIHTNMCLLFIARYIFTGIYYCPCCCCAVLSALCVPLKFIDFPFRISLGSSESCCVLLRHEILLLTRHCLLFCGWKDLAHYDWCLG